MIRSILRLLPGWTTHIACLCLVLLIATGCTATAVNTDGGYSDKSPSSDGIGKVFTMAAK